MGKNPPAVQETWVHRSGRPPGKGNGSPLQYSCLENSMDRGAWRATVHGVTKSQTTEELTLTRLTPFWCHVFPGQPESAGSL